MTLRNMLQMKLNETFGKVKQIQDEKMREADSTNIDSIRNAIAIEANKVVEEHRNFVFQFIRLAQQHFLCGRRRLAAQRGKRRRGKRNG